MYEVSWWAVENGVDGPEEDGPGLVVEADDDRSGRQVGQKAAGLFAPGVSRVGQWSGNTTEKNLKNKIVSNDAKVSQNAAALHVKVIVWQWSSSPEILEKNLRNGHLLSIFC